MTAAPILPERQEWTVDDKARIYGHAGIATYWVIDPLRERMTLTEYQLGPAGEYEAASHTDDVFVTERPWKVSVDLPALTTRRADLLTSGET